MIEQAFRAMNTDCLVIVNGVGFEANDAARRAKCVVDGYERAFSRFLAESDLTRLNESPSSEVPVSAALAEIVARAIGYARLTGGVFDPLVLGDLESIGYDCSFERIGGRATAVRRRPRPAARWTHWNVDTAGCVVKRPIGQRIDLGGVAKGAAADAAMRELVSFAGALVDLGGDIRTHGEPAEVREWRIAVEDTRSPGGTIDTMLLRGGAIATSSVMKRRWVVDGAPVHHVIDPRTHRPAESSALQCTVIADTAEHADVAAKAGLILGPRSIREGEPLGSALSIRGVAWLAPDGEVYRSNGWSELAWAF